MIYWNLSKSFIELNIGQMVFMFSKKMFPNITKLWTCQYKMFFIFYFTMTQLAYSLLQRYISVSAFSNMKFMATELLPLFTVVSGILFGLD